MKNIELIDKAINKFNGIWPKDKFGIFCSDKYQAAILLCLAAPTDDIDAKVGEIHCGTTGCDSHYFEAICTEQEFLARKAERQNKPDWKDHNYKFIQQGKNGHWYGSDKDKPSMLPDYLTGDDWHYINIASSRHGEVIGDHRNTLEQRPAVSESDWPDEKRIDVIGTNGNDGLSYATKSPEFKHGSGVLNVVDDNDWHARGELPPVGAKFEAYFPKDSTPAWNAGAVAYKSKEHVILKFDDGEENYYDAGNLKKIAKFRPLRTEREKFIDAALSAACDYHKLEDILGDLFDAGFRQPDAKA